MTDEKKPNTERCPFSHQNIQDPYSLHRQLREEHSIDGQPGEMIWSDTLQAWMPLSYRLIKQIAVDHKNFLNSEVFGKLSAKNMPPEVNLLISMDGEEHAAKRKHVQSAFKTEEVDRWEPTARYIVQRQLEYALAGNDNKIDVVHNLAIPIPIEIICEVMGMEGESRIKTIKGHTDSVVSFLGHVEGDRFTEREEKFDRENRYTVPEFILRAAGQKRQSPDEKMLSTIVNDEFPMAGVHRKLNDIEIVSDTALLLFTGNITTTSLIGFCFYHLASNPEIMKEVQRDYSLIDDVITETVRLEAPGQATYRVAAADVTIGRMNIKKGDSIYLPWSAAGRDPQKYENPDTFDIHRKEKGNLSFGIGKHRCIGEKLAWMEARVTLEEALNRFEDLSVPENYEVKYIDVPLFRGLQRLELEYTLRK